MLNTPFWIKLLQPERRIHLRDTIAEMATASAILYGGVAIAALVALSFPTWPGLIYEPIYVVSAIAITIAAIFSARKRKLPLWLMVTHIPFGLILAGVALYAGQTPSSAIISIVFILSSIYTYHYLTILPSAMNSILTVAIYIYVAIENNWPGWEAQAVFLLGSCVAAGFMVNVLVNRLNRLATRDGLTGLYNRHTWDLLLEQQINFLSRQTKPVSIMLVDLDYFKNINDSQGHLAGDKVLQQVSDAIKTTIRSADVAARWGGDEFIVLLPNCDAEHAHIMEARLRRRLTNIITFCAGIAQLSRDDTTDVLLQRADQMLYAEKRSRENYPRGKNMANIFPDIENMQTSPDMLR